MAQPGWLTGDLEDAWVDDEEAEEDVKGDLTHTADMSIDKTSGDYFHGIEEPANAQPRSTSRTPPDSPPASGGTFLIRDDLPSAPMLPGMGPGRGAKSNPFGKDIFSPLALERMFEPPSPPRKESGEKETSHVLDAPPQSSPKGTVTNGPAMGYPTLKRTRLSECILAADLSRSGTASVKDSSHDGSRMGSIDFGGSVVILDDSRDQDEILETDLPGLASFDGRKPSTNFQFTFNIPPPSLSPLSSRSASTLATSSTSQQKLEITSPTFTLPDHAPVEPHLRLFQLNYDTYTRDHLSALVDSIAVQSPSTSLEQDRENKRIKLSVSPESGFSSRHSSASPSRRPAPNAGRLIPSLRTHYLGESQALMSQLRLSRSFELSLATSTSIDPLEGMPRSIFISITPLIGFLTEEKTEDMPSPPPPTPLSPPTGERHSRGENTPPRNKRSSVAHRLEAASSLMAQIKSEVGKNGRRVLSSGSETQVEDSVSYRSSPGGGKRQREIVLPKPRKSKTGPSPRKLLRRLSAADEVDRELDDDDDMSRSTGSPKSLKGSRRRRPPVQILVQSPGALTGSPLRSSTARSSRLSNSRTNISPTRLSPLVARHPSTSPPSHPNRQEDMARFVSSSTANSGSGDSAATGASSASSYVKHAGQAPSTVRRIAPEDVGPIPRRVGIMTFDPLKQIWFKEDDSEDVFRGIESLSLSTSGEAVQTSHSEGEQEADEDDNSTDVDDRAGHDTSSTGMTSNMEMETESDSESESDVPNVDFSGSDDEPQGESSLRMKLPADMSIIEDSFFGPPTMTVTIQPQPAPSQLRHQVQAQSTPLPATIAATPTGRTGTPTSALKTPASGNASFKGKHARSVSFADGRRDGRLHALDSLEEISDSAASELFLVNFETEVGMGVPSARTRRIETALEALQERS